MTDNDKLLANLAEARAVIDELLCDDSVMPFWVDAHRDECAYCSARAVKWTAEVSGSDTENRTFTGYDCNHASDCPVLRARAWLEAHPE